MNPFLRSLVLGALVLFPAGGGLGAVELLDAVFELPTGFHIYRAAGPELSGGSYALAFDGEGRLLVGDGNAVRRLIDRDGDGVFDSFEALATGLGWRGPQGLLVLGDTLYAVGGDGLQAFDGYHSGKALVHRGRIGNPFNTGGDHDAHTVLRGHDGWLYLMAGNGAGIEDRKHITEESSPVLFEREASVFRISPDGTRWECVAAGGRNPPNLGMNALGDLFSFDSDMEWHLGLPWYRPVRLNHWVIGGDQGWQEVGAYPPYDLDCLPGILDVGRGSPTWGMFYEHRAFPEKYRDAYIVCDYRWKKESNDQYSTTGRLVVFLLHRSGPGWKASMEVLARPRPGARDAAGKPVNFALVDVAVAPDGSLVMTDHNQGIWRLWYEPAPTGAAAAPAPVPPPPPLVPAWPALPVDPQGLIDEVLALPQPGSERSRLREEAVRAAMGGKFWRAIRRVALDGREPLERRLRALRILGPRYGALPADFVRALSGDATPEIRGQAAWLLGIRLREDELHRLIELLSDKDPFVRRRAAEALNRFQGPAAVPALIERLADPERLVRYAAMTALAHYRTADWFASASARPRAQVQMRALVASWLRREPPSDESVRGVIRQLLAEADRGPTGPLRPGAEVNGKEAGRPGRPRFMTREDRLDLLRVLALFQKAVEGDAELKAMVGDHVLKTFPDADGDLRREQIRLVGDYRLTKAFPRLLLLLETEGDGPAEFHAGQSICRLPDGWTGEEENRLLRWVLSTQRGWFAQFDGKGVEFPLFWQTALADFGRHHRAILLNHLAEVDFSSLLGGVVIDLIAAAPNPEERLVALYRGAPRLEARIRIVAALKNVRARGVGQFLREEYRGTSSTRLRAALLQAMTGQGQDPANLPFLREGLGHEDPEVVRACAGAVLTFKPELDESLANLLLSRFAERRSLYYPVGAALASLTGQKPAGFTPEPEPGVHLEDATRSAAIEFWRRWYEQRFQRPFVPASGMVTEKSDEEIHRFIVSEGWQGGNAARGAAVYETLQCNTCHGGGVTPGREGRIFGPDLSGVTRRLSRSELADAVVYPSRQVADRFKAYEVERKDATPLVGFITEQGADFVTLADREQLHRIPRDQVRSINSLPSSLMPEHLLNRLGWDEIRDLLAFLDEGAGPGEAPSAPGK